VGPAELRAELLAQPGVKPQLASPEWVANHYKWVVWKLASYDRRFPGACRGGALSAANVLQQLLHRYRHELANGNRWAAAPVPSGTGSRG
jgi:breast cancer 2 susceptibility protein